MISYWVISVRLDESRSGLLVQQERDELYLSPHVRLAGLDGHACVESPELAEDFLEATSPILDKRYRGRFTAEVVECRGHDYRQLREQIYRDSAIIKARLRTENFAPNRKVELDLDC